MSKESQHAVRAVFLAAIMVISVFAAGIAFSGSAAAEETVNVSDSSGLIDAVGGDDPTASPGDTVVIEDDITLDSDVYVEVENVSIEGETGDETVTRSTDGSNKVFRINVDDVTLRDLNVERTADPDKRDSDSGFAHAIVIRNRTGEEISGVTVDNVDITGDGFSTDQNNRGLQILDGTGTEAADATDITVTNSSVSGFDGGFSVAATYGGDISDVHFVGNEEIEGESVGVEASTYSAFGNPGGTLDDVTVEGNDFGTFDDDARPVFELADTSDDEIDVLNFEAVFDNNEFERGALALDDGAVRTNTVDENGDEVAVGAVTPTISSSVAITENSDTVAVASGTYTESVDISTDGLTLEGPNADTSYDGDRGDEAVIEQPSGERAISITSDDIEISGFEILGNGDSSTIAVSGSNNELSGTVTITNNTVESGGSNTVLISDDSSPGGPDEVVISGNKLNDTSGTAAVNVYDGATHARVEITNNELSGDPGGLRDIDDLTFTDNDITVSTEYALDLEAVSDSTITGNEFESIDNAPKFVQVYDDSVELGPILNSNTFDGAVTVRDDAGDITGDHIFAAIQPAVDTASGGDTVFVAEGTYNESVDIGTENVTLVGPNAGTPGDASRGNEAVIQGQVDVNAKDVTVDGLQISPNTGTFKTLPAAAVIVENSNATIQNNRVADFTINITDIGVNSVQGIQIYKSGTELTGIEVRSNNVENISYAGTSQAPDGTFGTDYGNVYGIHVQGEIGNADVVDNTLRNLSSDGYTLAIAASGTDADPDANPDGVVVGSNAIDNLNAEASPATGFRVSSDSVNASNVSVARNSFDVPVDISNGASETLDAPLNYYGDEDTPTVDGNVIYDPLLTVPAEEAADEPQNIRNYGSYIEVETEGEPTVIGFPAPPAEPLGELLSNDTLEREDGEGVTFYIYDNENGQFDGVTDLENTTPQAGEVLVITTENQSSVSEEIIVPIETNTDAPIGAPTEGEVQLDTGWNLVATGAANSADDPIVAGTEVLAGTQLGVTQPSQPGAPSADVGAYHGTWILMDDDGILFTGYAPDAPPLLYADLTLNPDTDNSEAQE